MHLKRVRVPNFRVLQDVDITFEPDLIPRIFPLGSINGGGKSTLLQLIFTLLHCCGDEQRIPYLQNMLDGFDLEDDSGYRDLATIDLVIDGQDLELKFFLCDLKYLDDNLQPYIMKDIDISARILAEKKAISLVLSPSIQDLYERAYSVGEALLNDDLLNAGTFDKITSEIISIANDCRIMCFKYEIFQRHEESIDVCVQAIASLNINSPSSLVISELRTIARKIIELIDKLSNRIKYLNDEKIAAEFTSLSNKNKVFTVLRKDENSNRDRVYLMYEINDLINISSDKLNPIKLIADNIFLAAPATQVFHFLPKRDRLLLFRTRDDKLDDVNYSGKLGLARAELQGFFPYDAFSPEFLIETLESAIDNDIKDIRSTGKYGDSYPKLVTELEQALSNQKVSVDLKAGTITFTKTDDRGNTVELYPEDLSHGELKRLSLYVWLKYNNIENAIVLMDEVEIALHPDWQYGMINDLQTWAPNNQYILATHSYEMCQALTPAHVKEIEPKLLKKQK